MSDVVQWGATLRDLLVDGHDARPMRILTVPGVEYVGTVLHLGSDHVVLKTEFHVVTIVLAHIVSAQLDLP
ncbi:hypothetical protein [Blastococcus sp. KM273129]|uniref:hypothetical protein n=1 Tax=Blastococcus sp. KM273129 TaxID=2570315 RepID=UPI001F166261|nr:hypothetical protein [Blastococcus sp. KM273129]MCF6733670.1 hypothetical protein [Blastococcus sp. KM273129]